MSRTRNGHILAFGPVSCDDDDDDNNVVHHRNDGYFNIGAVYYHGYQQRYSRYKEGNRFTIPEYRCESVYSRKIINIYFSSKADIEKALDVIEAASIGSLGEDCATTAGFKSLPAAVALDPRRYDTARQKADMTALMLQNLGTIGGSRHNGKWCQLIK